MYYNECITARVYYYFPKHIILSMSLLIEDCVAMLLATIISFSSLLYYYINMV